MSLFFREIEVEGVQHVPAEGPLIYVANHPNGLVDPVLITAFLPRVPRFLAKHSLWEHLTLRPFLKLAGSIPIYRQQDRGARAAQNLQAFDASHSALAQGAVIGIFPEGVSHMEPSLQPLKSGVARVVLGAEEKFGPLGTKIVPVGLTFDARHRFRSRVLLTVGEPIDPSPEVALQGKDPRGARADLTDRVGEALRGVTLNYDSRREARLLQRAGDLYARGPTELPVPAGLSDLFAVRKRFTEGYAVMKEHSPEKVASLAREVDAYDRMLRVTGFRDEQIVSSYPRAHVAGYLARTLTRLLLFLPLAAAGTILSIVPYGITRHVAERQEDVQIQSTLKILGGIFLFPAAWLVEALAAGYFLGAWAVGTTLLLAPLTGYIAMKFHEDRGVLWRESLDFVRLRSATRTWKEMGRRRRSLAEGVAELAEEYRERAEENGGKGGGSDE
jgi:1-acyl-sn-glycerol-3-phosphate acyltransferase